jgi:hypothetical protein
MVRSIMAGVDPWGEAGVLTVGTTTCTTDGGTTIPRSASTACSVGRSYCGCSSSRAGCDSGYAVSCPASGGASTTSHDFSTSARPVSWMDVLASVDSMVT